MAKNTSIYITDDLWERIEADRKTTQRTVSNWFAVAAENELRTRDTPFTPQTVVRFDKERGSRG